MIKKKFIDFNSDMGESFGNWKLGNDEELMDFVTSANLACGFHAGDPNVMDKTVKIAVEKRVKIGCHFGLPDLEGFGRRRMQISNEHIANYVTYQLGALDAFLKKYNTEMQHVKIHGALFMMAAQDECLSKAILQAVQDYNKKLIFVSMKATKTHQIAKDMNFRVADEFYVDRGCQENGLLVFKYSWEDIGGSYEAAAMRLIRMLEENKVKTRNGKEINFKANSFCIHGDTPNAIEIIKQVKRKLDQHSYILKPLSEWLI